MTSLHPRRTRSHSAILLASAALTGLFLGASDGVLPAHAATGPDDAGVLDQPVPQRSPGRPIDVEALVQEVRQEQAALEALDRNTLERRAEAGERAAQVALGTDFAKEAALLSFAPEAANDALADAARWYSLAASRGFPGAPSLDQAGIRFYPIRVQRSRRPD